MELHQESLFDLSPESKPALAIPDEEMLIEDHRGTTRPAHAVDQKLVAAMRLAPINLSHLQAFTRPGDR